MKTRVLVVDDSPTVRRVVGTMLDRHGYEALLATDGQHALELLTDDGHRVDLVLLDFVMPRMNGYQLCRALRAKDELAALPVVLMSAKSDRIRDQFVQQTGALDAIAKPFDAQALLALLDHTLERVREGRVPPSMSSLPEAEPGAALSRPPSMPVVALGVEGERSLLTGEVEAIPVGAVLQMLQMERKSGAFAVRRGPVEVTIVLREGLIDFVTTQGTGHEFGVGRYFLEQGLLSAEELTAFRAQAETETGGDLIKVLSARGRVNDDEVRRALERRSAELVYEVLRWQRGRFELRKGGLPEAAESVRLGLPAAHIILEGFRRVDEWREMERTLPPWGAVLRRDELLISSLREGVLAGPERTVLDLVDGARSVREVLALSPMANFEACKVLVQLLEARLVRRTEN